MNTVCAGACFEASRQNASLMPMDSGTDSLIRSASRAAAGRSVVYVSRARVSSICCRVAPRSLDEECGVLLVECLAPFQPGGDGVVDGHVLAVEGHLPRHLEPTVPAPAQVIFVNVIRGLLT